MNKSLPLDKKHITVSILLLILSLSFFGCALPQLQTKGGSLEITIVSGESASSKNLEAVAFIYSGIGPKGETFSVESSEQQVLVNNLTLGSWTVRAEGYSASGALLVYGESPLEVEVKGETLLDISLYPSDGIGNLRVSADWDGNYTVSPEVTAVITGADGVVITENLTISDGNSAELIFSNLTTGFYTVSIQLYDSGELTAGGVWTVIVLNDEITEVTAAFNTINKTGSRVVITDSQFSIAWETDSPDDEAYRIYYRARGDYTWTLIDEITAAASPEFQITTSILSYGTWEFAVSSVNSGIESELHTSMDNNADPECGWYIDWIEI